MTRARILALIVASATVAVLVAATTSAGGAQSDPTPHLYVVGTDGEQGVALAKTNGNVLARYKSFAVVEAAGDDAQRLAAAGADKRDDMRRVATADGAVDPAKESAALAKDPPAGPSLAIVQFVGPIKDGWRERLEGTGVRVVTYMAQNSYLVHGSAAQLRAVSDLASSDPAVRGVAPFTADDKIATSVKASGKQLLAVQTLTGDDGASARGDVADAGTAVRDSTSVGPFRTQYVDVDAARAAQIASDPGVLSVEAIPAPKLNDEVQDQILAGALMGTDPLLPTGPGYFAYHEALGLGTATFPFSVDVTDSGFDAGVVGTTHPDFHVDGVGANPTRVDYADNYTVDADARDCGGHGTLNAGIVGGFNTGTGSTGTAAVEDANGYNYGLGVAPRVKLGGSKIFKCTGAFSLTSSFGALTASAYNKGARISSNSWGAPVGGAYTADAQTYDKLVRDADAGTPGNQQMVEVFSAGNDGSGGNTIGAPGTAKNVLTVGAAENVRAGGTDGCGISDAGADDAHDIIFFSSRGPTDDGRTKPDIVGPGTHVTGPSPQHGGFTGTGVCDPQFPLGNTFYAWSSGTSHSTPALAGMAALVREWYRQKKGGGTVVPSPALTKAILAGAGSDLAGGDNGASGVNSNVPDQVQGWGLGSLARALDTGPRYFRDQQDVLGATGDTFTRVFAIQDSTKPVRVTMAYTDAFGPTSGNSFVNDLNLRVDTGAGSSFKGNVFAGGQSVTGGTADPRNNLESIYLPAGTSGNFSVTVTAANIPGDGVPGNADATDQDFALTISNVAETTAPLLADAGTTVTPLGNLDAVLDPGEEYTVSQQVRNTGNAAATGIAGTMTGPPASGVTDGTAAWPNLAPNAVAANADPLEGTLSPTAPCGTPMTLSIAITSAEGAALTVPISVPTGGPGAPVAFNSTDVPKSIPDDNPAGVSSTLNVATAGIVKDVNVRIGSITHTFDGDLVLTITSPSGTTVGLSNRKGASGHNFTNTVFDDEAATAIGSGSAPFTGSFRPDGDQLSRFDGETQQGTWTLTVSDNAAIDTGTLDSWGIDVSPTVCTVRATTALTTTASPNINLGSGSLTDSVTVTGRVNPQATATVTFKAYGPNNVGCTGAPAFSTTVPYPPAGGPVVSSPVFAPASAGVYRWIASYSGDVNNLATHGACNDPNESVTVNPALTYSQRVLADGPAGYWRFAEASGTTALDSSPNLNHGTYLNGPTLGVPGALTVPNTAASFDGINDTVRVPDANTLDVGDSFTLEGWVKRTSGANSQTLFNKGSGGIQLTVMNAANGNQLWLRKANVTTIARSTAPVPADGNYHYVVVTKNGPGSAVIYIDGVAGTVQLAPVQLITDTAFPLTFADAGSTPHVFDEFALYDGVLTATKVAEHFAAR